VNVLVIAPHADDEVLGCGGTIARHAAKAERVVVAVVTRGSQPLFSLETVAQIRKETQEAHRVLGVSETVFLDFPAPQLDQVPLHEVADAIRKVVARVHPDVVYLPHEGDVHLDHKIAFWATLVACRPVTSGTPARLLAYETLSETEWGAPGGRDAFTPTVFVDISNQLDVKTRAMSCFAGQLRVPPHPRSLEAIRSLAHLRGSTAHLQAAEAFMLVREIIRNETA
jgi:LmbE family N-acetylglucosaminyl deacetylase